MSKRITAEELLHVGFVNKIMDTGKDEKKSSARLFLREVDDRLGDHT